MLLRTVIASVALLAVSAVRAEEPEWLKEARAREGKPLTPITVKSKDGWFTVRVPGKVEGDIVKEQDTYTLNIDVGSDAKISCEVIPDGFDLADMLRRTFDLHMQQVGNALGKVEARELESTDAGAIGGVPFLRANWIYRVNDGKEAQLGALKQVVFEKLGHGIYCAHLDLGYSKTFEGVMRALAASFEAPQVATPPYYLEIATASVGGKKLGVVVTRLDRDTEGDSKATQMSSTLFTEAGGKLHAQDTLRVEWVNADGKLLNASYAVSTNGNIETDAELKRGEPVWRIQGEAQGSTLDEKLAADAQPRSWVEQAFELRKLLAAGSPLGVEHHIALWTDADPGKLTDVRTKILAKKGPNTFSAIATAGQFRADLVLDAKNGLPTSADVPLGTQVLHIERVYESGSF